MTETGTGEAGKTMKVGVIFKIDNMTKEQVVYTHSTVRDYEKRKHHHVTIQAMIEELEWCQGILYTTGEPGVHIFDRIQELKKELEE